MLNEDEEKETETNKSTNEDSKGESAAVLVKDVPSSNSTATKRKRSDLSISTASTAELPTWVAGTSPAKFVSMDDLMKMSEALENMALVHEIAVNPEFVIEKNPANQIEQMVEDCMKKAYWDKLREDLTRIPPDYSCALTLLDDIKKMMLDLLTQHHVRLRSEIECILDTDLLKQQAENKCLDVRQLFESIVELLSRLCAPARDKMVNDLREKTDNVDMLRGVCELLDLMKLDMANFFVQINRSAVEKHSAEYERKQFMKLLDKSPELELSTMKWLYRHISMNSTDAPSAKKSFEDLNNSEVNGIVSSAYMELLEWDCQNAYPETLKIDRLRLESIATKYLQLIICTSCVLVSCNLAGKDVAQIKDFKTNLKNDVIVITDNIVESNIVDHLEAVSVLCNNRISKCCETLNINWTKEKSIELGEQILQIRDHANHVRKLIRDRMHNFILSITSNRVPSYQQRFPPGLSVVHVELSALTARFARIVNHNRETFGPYYGQLIKRLMNN
ncbi:T-complex protein 11 containing protein [Brugia malayi]|uniref:Bm5105, isoform c n=1 Tax=Brugia malayi TaxID=6279 RepID=A0A4E9F9M7_BRUMA|nr:T-complex protein 11 containing protein [Brugia malayi]VIO93537.1 T-complex protein 11 containing protein [Brugia malayi]